MAIVHDRDEETREVIRGQARRLRTSIVTLSIFLAVGLSGIGVNTAVLWALSVGIWHQSYVLASLVATTVSVVWNFLLLESFIIDGSWKLFSWRAFPRFWWSHQVLLPVQLGLLVLLVELASQNPLVANVVGLTVVFLVHYLGTTLGGYERFASRAAVQVTAVGDRAELLVTEAGPVGAPAITRVGLRLVAAFAAASMAFPAVAVHGWRSINGSPLTAVAVVFVLCAAGLLVSARAVPPPGDADVHDRQLDFILALPALAAAVFLSFAWPHHFTAAGAPGSREVLAFAVFTTGATLLLLGTRCTARLRLLLLAPLLMLPAVESARVLAPVLVLVFGVLVGNSARDGLTVGHPATGHRLPLVLGRLVPGRLELGRLVPGRLVPGRGLVARAAVAPPPRSSNLPTRLPTWRPTVLVVLAAALILGFFAVATPAPGTAAPVATAGSR